MRQSIVWKISGEAGFGIMTVGSMLAKLSARLGYHVIASNEYPSLIRGGHNVVMVGIGKEEFFSLPNRIDCFVGLDKESVDLHKGELHEGSLVLFDPNDREVVSSDFSVPVRLLAVPFAETIRSAGIHGLARNAMAFGAIAALSGFEKTGIEEGITAQFGKKNPKVLEENIRAAGMGFDAVKNDDPLFADFVLEPQDAKQDLLVVNGSEAVGIGALDGGMKFAAIYPMTPINALIPLFTDHSKELAIVSIQPEDELSGINMAIGASLAGAPSMVATSGGGFSLMVEGLSLAGMTEVPVVVDLGMRPGPATGMPTWTEQGELLFAIFSGHGDFARIVLAPGDAEECYRLTLRAFQLAQDYQVPVIVLTDKYLNENLWSIRKSAFDAPVHFDAVMPDAVLQNGFKRYDRERADGVSPRSLPGTENGIYIANSYEHTETGLTTEDKEARKRMVEKRMKKVASIISISAVPSVYGDQEADIAFVSFGSTKGPILEAMKLLKEKKIASKLIHFSWMHPLDGEKVKKLLEREKRLIIIEGNATGQLAKLIRQETGIEIVEQFLKYDGRQWGAEELADMIKVKD